MSELFRGQEKLNTEPESHTISRRQKGALSAANRRSSYLRKSRYVAAFLVCFVLVAAAGFGGLYLFFAGKSGRDSALVVRMEQTLDNLVGDDFSVEMNEASVEVSLDGTAAVLANDIIVRRKRDQARLAEIGEMRVEGDLTSAISGGVGFDYVSIRDARFHAEIFTDGSSFILPPHLNKPLDTLGETLARLQTNMREQGFRQFSLQNVAITGSVLGRVQEDPIVVQSLLVEPVGRRKFQMTAEIGSRYSAINLVSRYEKEQDGTSAYQFSTTGIGLREWLNDPKGTEGLVASNGIVSVSGRIGFRQDHTALDPVMRIYANNNDLRIGKKEMTEVRKLDLNFRLILARNQIELDPSEIEIGRLKATLVGGVKPFDDPAGYAGPLLYDIIMQKGEFAPTLEGEPVVPAGFKLAGIYDRQKRELQMNRIVLTTKQGAVEGSGAFGFTGETPSLKAQGVTDGISVVALKQFWPYFIADGARDWIHRHIVDGHVVSGSLTANIPPGIIFRLKQGAKMKPEHFKTVLNIENAKFFSFGEMPPIEESTGILTLEGMSITADVSEGKVVEGVDKPVAVESAQFQMEDFAARDKRGTTNLRLVGDATSIARISDRKPLRVMERMKVEAKQFSGLASADVVAEFPIRKGIAYEEVDWNVLLDLQNGASSKPIADRAFSAANLVIDANPHAASVTGKTRIDGIETTVKLVEPMGKSGKVKRSRTITAVLDNEGRKKLGLNLAPVIDGPVTATISQENGTDRIEVDFLEATLELPWIGWRKGPKIPATAKFQLEDDGKQYTLKDFQLTGTGFSAVGELVLNKSGLISAQMSKLSLNEGDDVSVKIALKNNIYEIEASGTAYDARGVINTLVYESSFAEAQGGRSVNLVANLGAVKGFKNRNLYNAKLRYQSEGGKLSLVDLRAQDQASNRYAVEGRRSGSETRFAIRSGNAGHALAFTNIYSRMNGGTLVADLVQRDGKDFRGPVQIHGFEVINEPRLARFDTNVRRQTQGATTIVPDNADQRVRFDLAEAWINKGTGYLEVQNAIIRNESIGFTAEGMVYDQRDRINMSGTFMAANVVNTIVSQIPILGNLLSDNNDPFIGVTYRLKGQRRDPQLEVNPLSIVAPGVFKKLFEYNQ